MFLHLNTGAGTEGLKSRRLRVKFFLDKPECRVRGFKEQKQKLSTDCTAQKPLLKLDFTVNTEDFSSWRELTRNVQGHAAACCLAFPWR